MISRKTAPDALLVLDVEGTLFDTEIQLPGTNIDSTIWQGIAHELGEAAIEEEIATHDRWENGEYPNYLAWMRDTIEIHLKHGLTQKTYEHLIESAKYNPGVSEFLSEIDRETYEIVLISGGFQRLARRVQVDFGINHSFAACEYFFDEEGELASYNLLPCDFEGKLDFIGLMVREYDMGPDDWYFVGDGANDVPIAKNAGTSIGYAPAPELSKVVDYEMEEFSELNQYLKH